MKKLNNYRFAILGKIIHTDYFLIKLRELGFSKPLVIISDDDEYNRELRLLKSIRLYSDIELLADKGLCHIYKMKNINSKETLTLFDEHKCNIAISINCRDIIKKPIIEYFKSKIFNLHGALLPDERGGGANYMENPK